MQTVEHSNLLLVP